MGCIKFQSSQINNCLPCPRTTCPYQGYMNLNHGTVITVYAICKYIVGYLVPHRYCHGWAKTGYYGNPWISMICMPYLDDFSGSSCCHTPMCHCHSQACGTHQSNSPFKQKHSLMNLNKNLLEYNYFFSFSMKYYSDLTIPPYTMHS